MINSSFNNFDSISRKYIKKWNKYAAVKQIKHYDFEGVQPNQTIFPEHLEPLAKHPKITALGRNKIQELLVRTSYKWMGDISAFEVEIITELCNKLATENLSVPVPDASRQVAILIGIDENYHAFEAREFILDIEKITGIDSNRYFEEDYPLKRGLNYVRENAHPSYLFESEVIALCLAEHFITEELLGLVKTSDLKGRYYQVTKAHLNDEIRHQAFFKELLVYLWINFEEPVKESIAKILPGFLDNFLLNIEPIRNSQIEILSHLGFTNEEAKQIIKDTYPHIEINSCQTENNNVHTFLKSQLPHTARCIELLHSAEITVHKGCRIELIKSGWLK